MNFLQRLIARCRRQPDPYCAPVVQPRVTPDPADAAALDRQFSELAYEPENGFERDRVEQRCRSKVVKFQGRKVGP